MAIGLDTASLISLLTEAVLFGKSRVADKSMRILTTGFSVRPTCCARSGFRVPPDREKAQSASEVSDHHRGHYDAHIWFCRK